MGWRGGARGGLGASGGGLERGPEGEAWEGYNHGSL